MSESLTNKVLELVSNLVVHSSINIYICHRAAQTPAHLMTFYLGLTKFGYAW